MTKKYQKLLDLSKKISKAQKPQHKRKIINKRNLPQNQDSFSDASIEDIEENKIEEEVLSDSINENEDVNEETKETIIDLSKNVLAFNSNTHLIVLEEGNRLLISSNYQLKILGGSATCLGWLIDPNSKEFAIQSKGKAWFLLKSWRLAP